MNLLKKEKKEKKNNLSSPIQQGRGGEPAGQDPSGPRAGAAGGQGEASNVPPGAAGRDSDGESQSDGRAEKEGAGAKTPAARPHAQGGGSQRRRAAGARRQGETGQDTRGKRTSTARAVNDRWTKKLLSAAF